MVACVLRTDISGALAQAVPLVSLPGGLVVTPWHPIRCSGKWAFPGLLVAPQPQPCEAGFSFLVLSSASASSADDDDDDDASSGCCYAACMRINGVECVTLAHGIQDDKVASHAFFGTEAVVRSLQACKGWEHGLVCLSLGEEGSSSGGAVRRDAQSGLICGFIQA